MVEIKRSRFLLHTMKLSPLSRLGLGALALGLVAYPVANSLAASSQPKATTATISCPASAAKAMATTEVPSISQAELTKAIADKSATVIDVNGTESFKAGRIPTALDFDAIKDLGAALPTDKGALIVAYCGSEHCGAYKKAAEAATALGYTNVKHFAPGIAGWKKSGAPVEKGA